MAQSNLSVVSSKSLVRLFGTCDRHVRRIREELGVEVSVRDGNIHIEGESDQVARATLVFERLQKYAQQHGELHEDDVERELVAVQSGDKSKFGGPPLEVLKAGRQIRPRTAGQAKYLEAIRKNEIVFCTGPAGTGKTYLAVAAAVDAMRRDAIRKIVLVRPAVEAGESLGFLPGDLQAKINPYLRPLLDALAEMMDFEMIQRLKEQDIIEVIPLAYMRGRTLSEAFIILDEAQNTTAAQMKMFLTRMGSGSRIVVSGDITQTDLPPHTRSGLIDAVMRLGRLKGIGSLELTKSDIVRHPLVQKIVDAYERVPTGAPILEKKRRKPRARGDHHGS